MTSRFIKTVYLLLKVSFFLLFFSYVSKLRNDIKRVAKGGGGGGRGGGIPPA